MLSTLLPTTKEQDEISRMRCSKKRLESFILSLIAEKEAKKWKGLLPLLVVVFVLQCTNTYHYWRSDATATTMIEQEVE